MTTFFASFLGVFSFTLFLLKSRTCRWALDGTREGPQKFHKRPTPRLGGLAIYLSLLAVWVMHAMSDHQAWLQGRELLTQRIWEELPKWDAHGTNLILWGKDARDLTVSALAMGALALLVSFPVFTGGIIEDITRKLLPRYRLGLAVASALLATTLAGGSLIRLDLPIVDTYLAHWPWFGVLLGVFLLAGLINSYNIIDGFNGLAAMVSILVELTIFYVAYKNQDHVLMKLCLAGVGASLGFLFWNYPRGFIFLGDGGAYFLGFFNGLLSIWLVNRNPQVSAWFAFLIHLYPVTETLFSIYRRKVLHGRPSVLPDALHFHSLIYRRLIRWVTQDAAVAKDDVSCTWRNSLTSTYLWALSLFTLMPALLWWDKHWPLRLTALIFVSLYIYLYRSIVRFKTPRFLVLRINTRSNQDSPVGTRPL